jgi:ubiquitin thioesterase protein OTUB1
MRMVTSTQIQSEPETYEPFLIHPDTGETMGVKEFCKAVVEVLGKEAGEHRVFLLFRMFRRCFADVKAFFSFTQIMCN